MNVSTENQSWPIADAQSVGQVKVAMVAAT
jgi:hypothetical protein